MFKSLFLIILLLNLININTLSAYSEATNTSNSKLSQKITLSTKSTYAILVDYDSGEVLYEKNADTLMVPSSMSKMMTTYLVFKAIKEGWLSLDTTFRVSKKAWGMGGSKMFIKYNDNVLVEDLIRGMIVQSGNDSCVALAEGMFGSEEVFVGHMNDMAIKLGMDKTEFKNATGWPEEGHLTTARDLAKLGIALIRDFPQYYKYHAEKEFTYNNIQQPNRNTLIGIAGIDGIKTGHTESGGYGIVISAKRNDMRLVAVLNGLRSNNDRIEEAESLLNYGFNNFSRKLIYSVNDEVLKVKVRYGDKLEVGLKPEDNIWLMLPRQLSNNFNELHAKAFYYDEITAPITNGQELGKLVINYSGKEIVTKLVANESVGRANFIQTLLQNIDALLL